MRSAPLTRFILIVATIVIFIVTRQPLLALVVVLLGAQWFDPVVDWLAHRSDPWLRTQLTRLLPSRWRQWAPGARGVATWLLPRVASLAAVVLVVLNYTPAVASAMRLDDWTCSRVPATPDSLCRSGAGTSTLSLADGGVIQIGLAGSAADLPFDRSRQNGPERQVEALILQDDRRSCSSEVPHVTIAVVTALSRTVDDISFSADEVGVEDLRGAALAQASYNSDDEHRTKICLLIANLGNLDSIQATPAVADVVQQLVLYAKHDPTFVGVVGFPFSSSARQALDALAGLGHGELPIVSPSVTSDQLDNASSFWRIASTDEVQAMALVDFLDWRLAAAPPSRALNVAVLVDDSDSYSFSLGNDLLADANDSPGPWLSAFELHYRVADASSIAQAATGAVARGADYVMLAGYAYDLPALELALESTHASVIILGGDGLSDLERYNPVPYAPVFASEYAPPLGVPLVESGQPCAGRFADTYATDFGAATPPASAQPAVSFPGAHAILAYDSVCMYGQALSDVELAPVPVTRDSVARALPRVSFDGLSGHTTFGDPSRPSVPDSKPVYVTCTDRTPSPRLAATVVVGRVGKPVMPSAGATPGSSCPPGAGR